MLFGVLPQDTVSLATAVVVLAGSALVAGFLPACRASRVAAMEALRCD